MMLNNDDFMWDGLFNIEMESAILGALLMDSHISEDVFPKLMVDAFYSDSHRVIYDAMSLLYRKEITIDMRRNREVKKELLDQLKASM